MADIELIKPRELPAITNAQPTDAVMLDNGVTVGKVTPEQLVNAGAAVASEAEALAGVNNTKRMTPLRTRQALDNANNPAVLRAQAWAESSTPPDPLLPDSKSAKTWASIAEQGTVMVQWSMIADEGQTVLGNDITTGEPIRAYGGVAQISVNGFGPITPGEYSVDSDGVVTLTAPLAEGDVVSGFTQPRLSNSEAQAVVQGVLQQTGDDVRAAQAILDRIDLGALDAATALVEENLQEAVAAKEGAEAAMAQAEEAAGAASDSQLVTEGLKVETEVFRNEAATYAETAATGARFYDTIALGRAAVADGETFGVFAGGSDGLEYPTIYRRDSPTTQSLINPMASGVEVGALTGDVIEIRAGMVRSPNLFNVATREIGKAVVETTGDVVSNGASDLFGRIPVEPGVSYRFSTLQRIVWETPAQIYISGQLVIGAPVNVDRIAPANAGFVRLSLPNSGSVDFDTFMVTRTSEWPDAYVAFGFVADLSKATPLPISQIDNGFREVYLETGKNLVDESASTIGVFVNSETGVIDLNANLRTTAMVPVQGSATYSFSGGSAGSVGIRSLAQYTADKTLIPTPMFSSPNYRQVLTMQPSAAFAMASYNNSAAGQFQMELGSSPTAYQPFTLRPKNETTSGVPIQWSESGNRPDEYGLERLREARARINAYRYGLTGRQAQLNIGAFGDSWFAIPGYLTRGTARSLWGRLSGASGYASSVGMIGRGYHTLRNPNTGGPNQGVRFDSIGNNMTIGGTWSHINNTAASASINGMSTSEVGAYFETLMDYSLSPSRSWRLHAQGGSGSIRYRWTDVDAWKTIDLSALPSGFAAVDFVSHPTTGTGVFRVEALTVPLALYGIMEKAVNAPGIVFSNFGGSGSSSANWVAVNDAEFRQAVTDADIDMAIILLGTNDAISISSTTYKENIREIATRIRTARPTCDILLVAPAQTTDPTRPISVGSYAQVLYELALENDYAFIDLQPSFGASAADYAPGGIRPWFGDIVHPNLMGSLSWFSRLAPAIGI